MRKIILFLMCILFSLQSFGFTEIEEAAAYNKISSCSKATISSRIKHLDYVKKFASEDNVPLVLMVENYNKLSCLTYDYAMLKIAESIALSNTRFSRIDILAMALRLYLELKGIAYFPSGILSDTLNTTLEVVTKSDNIDETVETYLDVFSTVHWHRRYTSDIDIQIDYEGSKSPEQAKEILSIYKNIWGV